MIICDLCFKAIMYCVRINGYFVCEECVEEAKKRQPKQAAAPAFDNATPTEEDQ